MKNLHQIVISLFVVGIVIGLACSFSGASTISAAPAAAQPAPNFQPLEMRLINDPRPIRLPPPADFNPRRRAPSAANIVVNYLLAGQKLWSGTPSEVTCLTFPDQAKTAFNYAAQLAGSRFNSAVTTTIDACWGALPTGVLGRGGAADYKLSGIHFTGGVPDTWYADALANALAASDLDPANPEIQNAYGNTIDWYFGTDGNPGTQTDFVSVALHEIIHGMGFLPSFSYSSGTGSWGMGTIFPMPYDRFVYNGSGQFLLTSYANPSFALGDQLVGDNLFFRGTNATAANGGGTNYPKLYAPTTWSGGSSISHLDYVPFSATELMVYAIAPGQSKHNIGNVSIGVMKDIGWTTPAPPGTNYLYLPLILR
ncbi:MAG: hypothetical protein FJ009_17735 [Chloroflexi bacterium]|nr:hypothetical protein [Chloroflexota bacterium]